MKKNTATYLIYGAIIVTVITISLMFRRYILPQRLNDKIDSMTDAFNNNIFNLISGFEGYDANAYHDKIDPANVWTIGYGSIYNYDAKRPVQKGDTVTKEKALEWFYIEANEKVSGVRKLVKVPINENQLLALSSFAYNLGLGDEGLGGSTLLKLLNQGFAKEIVAQQFGRWVYSDGNRIEGLAIRRAKEKALFLS